MPLMLPCAPQFSRYENNWSATPPTGGVGTAVSNPAGAANTKNTTWTQLIASTAFDTQLIIISLTLNNATNTDTSTLLDIGIGAASSESVIIPDLLAGFVPSIQSAARTYIFPLYIPAASRLSARTASVRTTGSVTVSVELFGGPRNPDSTWSGHQVTAYGINTADSGAVSVTAGNTGAETASPVSIGTTTSDHEVLVLGCQGNKSTYSGAIGYHFDVGIDTASTEWLRRDGFYVFHNTSEHVYPGGQIWWPIYQRVPSGSVLVVGGEASGTAETLDFAIYGVS